MKIYLCFLCLLLSTWTTSAQEIVRVEARPENGFYWPYLYYVPQETAQKPYTLLILPNNSGKVTDDLAPHEASALKRTKYNAAKMGDALGVVLLRPIFPRTQSEWRCYTHALDRDTLLTRRKEVERLDLQLLAMVDDLRRKLDGPSREKFLIAGFSASGMFANRFTLLHPDRVLGAAVGSPGGWPIAPVKSYKDEYLRYPVGVADFRDVSGKEFDQKSFSQVPMLLFLGDQDENDSVPYTDGYDPQDAELVMKLFGDTPVGRWEKAQEVYRQAGSRAEFRLYPGVEHLINKEIAADIREFFRKLLPSKL